MIGICPQNYTEMLDCPACCSHSTLALGFSVCLPVCASPAFSTQPVSKDTSVDGIGIKIRVVLEDPEIFTKVLFPGGEVWPITKVA